MHEVLYTKFCKNLFERLPASTRIWMCNLRELYDQGV